MMSVPFLTAPSASAQSRPFVISLQQQDSANRVSSAQSTSQGDFQRYPYMVDGTHSTTCLLQVGGSASVLAMRGSCSGRNFHQPQTSVSRGRSLRVCNTFLGSNFPFRKADHVRTNDLCATPFMFRIQNAESSQREMEEARWQREEKRWLREEERWLREEARWATERKCLLEQTVSYREEINALKQEIAALKICVKGEISNEGTLSERIVSLSRLLQSFGTATLGIEDQKPLLQAQISSSSSSTTDIGKALGSALMDIPNESFETITEVSQPLLLDLKAAQMAPSLSYAGSKRILKRGAEGDDVKALQEALANLGFYSGEDDMEFSTFSSGTERAVRSWQASLGALEDGIVTMELLKRLFNVENPTVGGAGSSTISPAEAATSAKTATPVLRSGAHVSDGKTKTSDMKVKTSSSAISEKVDRVADSFSPSKPSVSPYEPSQTRVYLLGENRWEEPNRLVSENGPTSATAVGRSLHEKCFACKGQGSMMCTECEGTGEMNVEEQFLEWVDEGAKCPYCEGKGVLDCDVCDGKGVKADT